MFDDIFRVSRRSTVASDEDILRLETHFATQMPRGYAEFVKNFGEGSLTGWLDIRCPWQIESENRHWQERVTEYFFWDDGKDVLERSQVAQSILLAHTGQGDELIFHPSDPSRLLVLPRNEQGIHVAGSDLEEAVEWIFKAGKLGCRLQLKAFEPQLERANTHFNCLAEFTPPGLLKRALFELGVHDAFIEENEGDADDYFKMYVQEFGGSVVLLARLDYSPEGPYGVIMHNSTTGESFVDGIPMQQIPRRPELWIDHEQGVEGAKFEVITDFLAKHGLVRGRTIPAR